MSKGRIIRGIECPIIRKGDDLIDIVVQNILNTVVIKGKSDSIVEIDVHTQRPTKDYYERLIDTFDTYNINNKDIVGITESVVARAAGQYITVDDIAKDVEKKFGKDAEIALINPIYSRNRFSMILKGIARSAKKLYIIMPHEDEVGNPSDVNPYTGVNIEEYYKELCKEENCECICGTSDIHIPDKVICCQLRNYQPSVDDYKFRFSYEGSYYGKVYSLADICSDVSPDWGVLGTNKATDEVLKLFPSKAECQRVCEGVKAKIKELTGKDVIVCVYGDGCYKDATSGIWEFADPTTMPGYTDKDLIESSPHEIKLKSLIDSNGEKDFASDEELKAFVNKCKSETSGRINNMSSMGTTPRIYRDLIASLMDLTSGSGDKATPVVLVQNYF